MLSSDTRLSVEYSNHNNSAGVDADTSRNDSSLDSEDHDHHTYASTRPWCMMTQNLRRIFLAGAISLCLLSVLLSLSFTQLLPAYWILPIFMCALLLVSCIRGMCNFLSIRRERLASLQEHQADTQNSTGGFTSGDYFADDDEALLIIEAQALNNAPEIAHSNGASQSDINRLPVYHIPKSASTTFYSNKEGSGLSVEMNEATNTTQQAAESNFKTEILKSQCVICLEKFKAGDSVRILGCFHRFHCECVDKWLSLQATCPICKTPVF